MFYVIFSLEVKFPHILVFYFFLPTPWSAQAVYFCVAVTLTDLFTDLKFPL